MAKTSGEIYHNAVRRGLDNGYAMWLADEWQMRHDKKECEWCGSLAPVLHTIEHAGECYEVCEICSEFLSGPEQEPQF